MPQAIHNGAEEEILAKRLWAIGDATRLRLLRLLPSRPECESGNNVSALAEKLGLSQPAVSHHLRILRQAGIVTNRKMCRDVFYWIHPETTTWLLCELESALKADECDGQGGSEPSISPAAFDV